MTNPEIALNAGFWHFRASFMEERKQHTQVINTVNIADRIDRLRDQAAVMAVALEGLGKASGAGDARNGLIGIAWQMSEDLEKLSNVVLPNGGLAIAS